MLEHIDTHILVDKYTNLNMLSDTYMYEINDKEITK